MNETQLIERSFLRSDVPIFRPGDTVKVHVRVVEGNRERVQVFQGVVIRRQGGGVRETFTVRKISFGIGVERTFPVHSPSIAKLEIVQRGQVRRAKLYYLRDLRGKKARIRERRVDEAKIAAQEAARAEDLAPPEPDVDPEVEDAAGEPADTSEPIDTSEPGEEAPSDAEAGDADAEASTADGATTADPAAEADGAAEERTEA